MHSGAGDLGRSRDWEIVLSVGKVGGGAADPSYYLDTVAFGAEDYYAGRGEARGR